MAEQVLTPPTPETKTEKASYEEYLQVPHEGHLVEWVNGEVIHHMPPKPVHQFLVDFLTTVLTLFAEYHKLGKVISSPIEMKCASEGNSREPDILFLAEAHLDQIGEARIDGPADLVIEIVSDDSVARDFDEKFVEYQECGIPEYWIIDPRPRRHRALFYQLNESGMYELVYPEEGIYRSKALTGFWLRIDWLWELPETLPTFLAVAGVSPEELAGSSPS